MKRKYLKERPSGILLFVIFHLLFIFLFLSSFVSTLSLKIPPKMELLMNLNHDHQNKNDNQDNNQDNNKNINIIIKDAINNVTDANRDDEKIIGSMSKCELIIDTDGSSDKNDSASVISNGSADQTDNNLNSVPINDSSLIGGVKKCVNLLNVTFNLASVDERQAKDNESHQTPSITSSKEAPKEGFVNHGTQSINESLFTIYYLDQDAEDGSLSVNESITIKELRVSDQLTNKSNISLILEPDLMIHHPILAIFLSMICVTVIAGNILVMIAIKRERVLRTITNYFVASLAFADCLVGLIVMPVSIVHEVLNKYWIFGQDACDLWHSFDVLASTASILNLCVISMDR